MRCIICKRAYTEPGTTTVTLERDCLTMVVKGVPAQVCPNCSEAYADGDVVVELLATAEKMAEAGTQVDIHNYVEA